jgi:hypothetical protein
MTLDKFLRRLDSTTSYSNSEVVYLQSQNGNIHSGSSLVHDVDGKLKTETEFERLKQFVPRDIDWASQAFGKTQILTTHLLEELIQCFN